MGPPSLLHPRKDTIYANPNLLLLAQEQPPRSPAPAPKRRRGGQSDNTKDLDPKDFEVYAIMAHQGKTLRVLV